MREIWESFNNREIALVAWTLIGVAFGFRVAGESMLGVAKSFLTPKIAVPFLGLAVYAAMLSAVLARFGLWDTSLLKDTAFWYVATGVILFRAATTSGEDRRFFQNIILDNLRVALILEFALSFYVMPLWAELLLVPVLVLLGAMQGLAESRKEHRILLRPLAFVISVISIGIALNGAYLLYVGFREFTTIETLRQLLLAPMLTILSVPYILSFALWVQYEGHFIRLDLWLKDRPDLRRYAKRRSILECGFNISKIRKLVGDYYCELHGAQERTAIRTLTAGYAHAADPVSLSGEVSRVRIVPYKLPANGQMAQVALIDWTNISDQPVGAAFAEITAFDADGVKLQSGASEHCIYYCDDDELKVGPGETYVEPDDEGYILLSNAFGWADRVEVRITKLLAA